MDKESQATKVDVESTAKADGQDIPLESIPRDRLLEEAKKHKERWQAATQELEATKVVKDQLREARKELEAIRKKDLDAQGKEKERGDYWENRYKLVQSNLLKEKIGAKVNAVAAKAGCVDPNALMKLGDSAKIQYDEETYEIQGVEDFVEEAKRNYSYLFKTQSTPSINPITPGGMITTMDFKQELKTAKSQADLDRILKKHGKI